MDIKSKYDFDRMCRVCLSESSDMTNLFDSDRNIDEIVMTCSDVKLLKNDGLPAQICRPCIQQADNALSFKQKCELSDTKLRYYITNSFNISSDLDIKEEQSLLGISDINDYFKYENQTTDSLFSSSKDNGYIMESSFLKYECALCKNMCESSKDLVDHVLTNHTESVKTEDDNHVCEICKRKYSGAFELKKHQATHKDFTIDGKKLVCPLCRDQFFNHDSILRHLCYHLESSNHECDHCKCFFTSKLHLKRHNQRRHNLNSANSESHAKQETTFDPDDILIKSEIDGDIDETNLTLGSNTCELDNDLDLETEDFIASIGDANLNEDYIGHTLATDCTDLANSDYDADNLICDIMDKKLNKFSKRKKRSSKRKHDLINDITIKKELDDIDEDCSSDKKLSRISKHLKSRKKADNTSKRKCTQGNMFSCEECPKKFLRLEYLEDHKKRHTGERSYLCSKCGKGYFKQSHLDKHMETHQRDHAEKPIYSCPLCSRVVTHSNHLQAHMRTHKTKNGEPIMPQPANSTKVSHLCSTCGRSCSSRSNLAVHMRRHLGTKTCICKICGKGYPRTTDLTLHMRQHTGERPFICSICNRAFARSDKLAIHMRTHTGEKPYSCSVCGRSFAQSNDLSSHKKRNTCSQTSTVAANSALPANNVTSCTNSEAEEHLLLLAQNTQLEITPVEFSLPKGVADNDKIQHNQNYYKSKRKKSTQYSRAINLATNSSQISNTEDEKHLAAAQPRPAELVGVPSDMDSNCEIVVKNVNDLIKQSFVVHDLVSSQRALDFASGNHNNILAHQRTDLTDFTTAALLQIQSAHFGLR